jgi:WD40 repeat protein
LLRQVPLELPKGKCYERLSWAPDGTLAASLGGRVHFISTATGQLLEELEAHDDAITALHWAPVPLRLDPSTSDPPCSVLATSSKDRRVRLWRSPASL